ncbi:SRPBCC family protein [Pedobacter sp. G11]|uniref:SRPBCC family protein n=1 Tax=Pedobacter sp. G11 TaxID=2482728 RepID=UPI001FEDB7DE|nr:SRPBCC family protein [Pedobacter sp. G11]
MKNENEEAIAGCTSGLIGINETVTWKAKHLGFYFTMTSRISEMKIPVYFIDEMVKGPFKRLRHQHIFAPKGQKTEMTDIFEFSAPFGWLGVIVEKIFLKSYMKRLLLNRNKTIQEEANKY